MRRAFVVTAAVVVTVTATAAVVILGRHPATSVNTSRGGPPVAREAAGAPPAPQQDALALAAPDGDRVVALAVENGRLTASVTDATGEGLSHLEVRFHVDDAVVSSQPCGTGCYRAASVAAHPRRVDVVVGGRSIAFPLPPRWPNAATLLAGISRRYRQQRAVAYSERLGSSSTSSLETAWRFEAPDRTSYRIAHGAQGIVVGGERWDRDSTANRWGRSPQVPRLFEPRAPWGAGVYDVRLLERTPERIRIAFVGPGPVWYVVTVDPERLLLRDVRMIATAHLMHDTAFSYGGRIGIAPPR